MIYNNNWRSYMDVNDLKNLSADELIKLLSIFEEMNESLDDKDER